MAIYDNKSYRAVIWHITKKICCTQTKLSINDITSFVNKEFSFISTYNSQFIVH